MEQNALTQQQRDLFIQQINLRIAMLPDEALIKLESVTRHPESQNDRTIEEEVQGQALLALDTHRSAQLEAQPALPGQWYEQPQVEKTVSRREALLLGTTGLFGLLSLTGGGGWLLGEQKLNEIKNSVAQVGDTNDYVTMQSIIYQMNDRLALLSASCADACVKKDGENTILREYQAAVNPTINDIAEFRKVASELIELYQNLTEENLLTQVVESFLTKNPFVITALISSIGSKIELLIQYYRIMPDLVRVSNTLLVRMDQWFEEQNNIDIRLLEPIHDDLFDAIDTINTQAQEISALWETDITPVLSPAIEKWKFIHNQMGG